MPEKLRAVLANFGYSEKVILLTQHSARCVTLSCVSQFWIFEKFSKIFRKINIWTLDSLETEMFESQKYLFDSTL